MGSLAATAALSGSRTAFAMEASPGGGQPLVPGFPRKDDFRIAEGYTYLNGAYTHPMPIAAAEACHAVVNRRSTIGTPRGAAPAGPFNRPEAKAAFASLINAKPNEVSFLPNTSTGENLVVEFLDITQFNGNVVTDALHFEGALVHLYELQKQGLDLRVVMPTKERRSTAPRPSSPSPTGTAPGFSRSRRPRGWTSGWRTTGYGSRLRSTTTWRTWSGCSRCWPERWPGRDAQRAS